MLRRRSRPRLAATIYIELVRLLFTTFTPIAIMGTAVTAGAFVIAHRASDPLMLAMGAAAIVITTARIAAILAYRRIDLKTVKDARRWERIFAIGSFAFALLVGGIGLRTFAQDDAVVHMLATALVLAYGAGIMARVSMRPAISIVSLTLASAPFIVMSMLRGDIAYFLQGAILTVMLLGGFETVFFVSRTVASQITIRDKFKRLAQADPLTGLPNRLMLEETMQASIDQAIENGELVAVHFLDLDRFKEANDRYGHSCGDELLVHTARRLRSLLRTGDLIARIGGDEFIVAQTGISRPEDAEILAQRLGRAIAAPFHVGGERIEIGVSIGIAVAPTDGVDAQDLIAAADSALYNAKRSGRGRAVLSDAAAPDLRLHA